MALSFNSKGNLHQTISLTYEKFRKEFVSNPHREQQLGNALRFCRIFYSCGCATVYVGGSFVSEKKFPEDIDLCFDITTLDDEKLKKEFPQFFDPNEIGKIRREFNCHIFHYHDKDTFLLDAERRPGWQPKGIGKIRPTRHCSL